MTPYWIAMAIVLTGIGLAFVGITLIRYYNEIGIARKRIKSLGSQVIQTGCGPVECVRVGEGYPVLVVHGAMGGFDQGLWLARSFNLTDHQVISISRFGYLRSPLPAGANLDLQADAFAALLDALEIRQAVVFAASAGATSAIRFTARYPERVSALVLLCPDAPGKYQSLTLEREGHQGSTAGESMTLPPRFLFDTLLRSDFFYWLMVTFFGKQVQSTIGLVPKGYVLTPDQETQVKNIQKADLPVSQRMDGLIFETYTCDAEFKASITPSSSYPLSEIETPALVLNAQDDPIARPENVRNLAEQMPNSRLFVVPEGGHFFFGHVEEAKSQITQFLRSHMVEQ